MTQARGSSAQLLLDYETSFGADPVAPSGIQLPIISCSLRSTRNQNQSAIIRASRSPAMPFDGYVQVAGDVVAPVDITAMWYWLKLLFGAPTTSGDGPYVHVFTVGTGQPSAVIEKGFTDIDQYFKYNGVKASGFSMELGGDGELTFTVNLVGSKETISATAYDGTPAEVSLSRLNIFQANLREGGEAITNVTRLSLNFDMGLDASDENRVISSSVTFADIPEGVCRFSGELTALFENAALLNKAINSTETSLKLTITSGNYSLVIELPELKFGRQSPDLEGPGGVRVSLPFDAYYDNDASASAAIVTLTNADAHT